MSGMTPPSSAKIFALPYCFLTAATVLHVFKTNPLCRPQSHIHYRDALSDALTDLRQDIFKTLISDEALSSAEFVMGIVSCSDLPQVKKNIAVMVMAGLEEGCIADMNCVSKGFVKMYNRTLREDFPEIFAEM